MDRDKILTRIAEALERGAPETRGSANWRNFPAYVWEGQAARAVELLDAPQLGQLHGIDSQKERVVENIARHAAGHAAHDMLLWGARGMGKSALVRAALISAQEVDPRRVALVQVRGDALTTLPRLFSELARAKRRFVVFLDDLGFADDDPIGPRALRSLLEGGVDARPDNVRMAITSNRRVIVPRQNDEQDSPINPRDEIEDRLALADRFGLSVGFHSCSKDTYLAIVEVYAKPLGLDWEEGDALAWAMQRGARSGRTAWQYVTEIAGRAGKTV
ncbi:DUF815 domain-containing protein [Altererythrobacter sp. MF3-039]|uniref:DUF815 domain-containing protein n=1 Tax=Altererythrobacter sp. MF3-039 TaxID=3252901 RepID=UPI00390C92B3